MDRIRCYLCQDSRILGEGPYCSDRLAMGLWSGREDIRRRAGGSLWRLMAWDGECTWGGGCLGGWTCCKW